MGIILTTLRWAGIALLTAIIYTLSKRRQTLDSMIVAPHDVYTPDFYPGGHDVQLPVARMHYWLFGNPQGKKVVLIHGISTGSVVWDRLARFLADKGHYVLVYDTWGRGYTQAPNATYDESLYTSQLAMLLQKVGWTKCDVVGVSLGGATAMSFANYYPEMVDKTVLIAPAGIMNEKTDLPLISRIIRLPFVYQVIINQPVFRDFMLKNVQKFANSTKSKLTNYPQETLDQGKKISTVATYQFAHHPGFIRAFAGTVVAYPLTGLHDKFKKLGQQDRDILVVWGDRDTTCPYYPELVKQLLPKAQLAIYPEQAHNVLSTRWESVHDTIEKFLTS
ncbi:hypothetical protein MBANPS3_007852 [Mucor bainieri]